MKLHVEGAYIKSQGTTQWLCKIHVRTAGVEYTCPESTL